MTSRPPPRVDETAARQVLLLRAFEDDPDPGGLWTTEDRSWAHRAARASAGPDDDGVRFVFERAHHAAQRLRARVPAADRFLTARFALTPWLLAALLLGLVAGVAVDQIGPSQRINLLAAPIGLLLLWNGVVYLAIATQALWPAGAMPRPWRGLRQRLPSLWLPRLDSNGPLQRLAMDWARASAPLNSARVALLMHAAAAALATGVVGGLYARGLVLDYRAGWQSTFLEPATVQRLLATALAPASAVTGIGIPDVDAIAALRITPDAPTPTAAAGTAAPWLHLFAATLALFVIGPRLLLAAAAAGRVRWLSHHWALPWNDAYFQALLRSAAVRAPRVWLLPHAAPVAAAPALALQALLSAAHGSDTPLRVADPVGLGQEHDAARCTPPVDSTLVLVLVDMAATPEAEAQGRLLDTLKFAAACPQILLLDEAAFVSRFGGLGQRLRQRRQAWQELADQHAVPLLVADLSRQPPDAVSVQELRRVIGA